MKRPRLILAPGKEKAVMRRHPWIFSGAVARIDGDPVEGDVVDVCLSNGRWIASGHYQNDTIICKVLSFETDCIDADFFRQRLESAIAYRRRLGFFDMRDTNVFRLVHAEGDLLPGLVCDWYNGVLVMQAHSQGMHRIFPMLAEIASELLLPYALVSIFDKSSATISGADDGYIWGVEPDEWEVVEHDNKIMVNFYEGPKTGFFIDQRENRELVSHLSNGCRVLNCFGYTTFRQTSVRIGAGRISA